MPIASGFAITTPDAASAFREGVQTSPQRAGATPEDNEYSDGTRNFWAPEGGNPAISVEMPVVYVNDEGELVQTTPTSHEAQQTNMPMTAPNGDPIVVPGIENGVMTFAQWHGADMPIGNFWVMDAEEGWFYYAMPLPGGQATSMLLSGIEVSDNNDEGIEYVIQVDAQFAIRSRVATDMFDEENEPVPQDVAMLWGEFGYEVEFEGQDEPLVIERETPTLATEGSISMSRVSLMGGTGVSVPNPTVVWTIEGPVPGSSAPPGITVVSATGEITVDNTAVGGEGVAYVVATAEASSGGMAEARRRIDVLQFLPNLPAVAHLQENVESGASLWTDPETGIVWRVLLPDDGNGNALIMTEHVHGLGTPFRNDGINGFRTFEGSNLQTVMNEWYKENVGAHIRAAGLSYEFQNGVRQNISSGSNSVVEDGQTISAGIEVDFVGGTDGAIAPWVSHTNTAMQWGMNMTRGMTRPTGNPGSGEVFALSLTEIYTYFAGTRTDAHQTHNTHLNEGGVDRGVDRRAQAATNAELENTIFVFYWLRSPGSNEDALVRRIAASGNVANISANVTNNDNGFRPALWVRR